MDEWTSPHFTYTTAVAYEPGVTRRDPSPVIRWDGLYHAYYTRATRDPSGYYGTVWHATSQDGHTWVEQGEAIGTGPPGEWDSNGVFTPTTLLAAGRVYVYYTAVPQPFDNDGGGPAGTPTAIGMAVADTPDGPFTKFAGNPVLRPGAAPAVDSHRVDDACFVVRDGRYWMYYKGRASGLTPAQTRTCLAVATDPCGPFEKSTRNPVIDGGHEVCVWPHGKGVAALVSPCGPEGNTVQFSQDGERFRRVATVSPGPPSAPGPYRADAYAPGPGPGITWGLCQCTHDTERPYLLRFDVDLQAGTP